MAVGLISYQWIPSGAVLAADFFRMADKFQHTEEALRKIVSEVAAPRIEAAFDTETGPDGGWAPLASGTLDQKSGDAILVNTGDLKGSVTGEGAWSISSEEARLGLGVDYGWYHENGTVWMPRREFAYFTAEDIDYMGEILDEWAGEAIGW